MPQPGGGGGSGPQPGGAWGGGGYQPAGGAWGTGGTGVAPYCGPWTEIPRDVEPASGGPDDSPGASAHGWPSPGGVAAGGTGGPSGPSGGAFSSIAQRLPESAPPGAPAAVQLPSP